LRELRVEYPLDYRLLATLADHTRSRRRRISMLAEIYESAKRAKDQLNLAIVASDLTELLYRVGEPEEAQKWLRRTRRHQKIVRDSYVDLQLSEMAKLRQRGRRLSSAEIR
jgi:hypothetical protein